MSVLWAPGSKFPTDYESRDFSLEVIIMRVGAAWENKVWR